MFKINVLLVEKIVTPIVIVISHYMLCTMVKRYCIIITAPILNLSFQ